MSHLLVDIKALNITFGDKHVLKDFDFSLAKGEIVSVVGESGSGKSISALMSMGLLAPTAEVVNKQALLFGQELESYTQKEWLQIRGKRVSMIFQDPMTALHPSMRVGKQLDEVLVQHTSLSSKERKKLIISALTEVELPSPGTSQFKYPHELSGGQRQRVVIAMAMLLEPELIIADEPTTALDVTIQAQILDLMTKLKDEIGMSILFITHDLGLIEKFSDTITVMQEGQVVEQGLTHEVFANPQHEYTQKLINAEPSAKKEMIAPEPPIISVRDLNVFYSLPKTKLFKKDFFHAVKDVNFSIPKNSTIGLVGESGSGKSTLGKALAGLIKYDGSVEYQGNDIAALNPKESKLLKKDIQIIFQDPYGSLSPRMTIGEIVGEGLDVHFSLNAKEKEERITECLNAVEINPDQRFKYPHEFSGGQRQRVAIARSLILNPAFMILDEPTSALDRSIQIQVIELLKNLQEKFQLTYLFISHDLKVVRSMSDYIFVMQNGVIVESGPANEVFSNPEQDYTDKLLNAALKYSTV